MKEVQAGSQASSREGTPLLCVRLMRYARLSAGRNDFTGQRQPISPIGSGAIFLMATTRMGIAAKHLEREVGCSYKTAWRMMRMIRKLMTDDISELTEMLGQVEIDESYFGGRAKFTHIDPETGWHRIPERSPFLVSYSAAESLSPASLP